MEMYMFLCKLLVSLLLLLAPNNGLTNGVGSATPSVPNEEVGAINVLLNRVNAPSRKLFRDFSSSDCNNNGTFSTIVRCDRDRENNNIFRVTTLDFSNYGITGQIPAEIGNLTYLRYLYLDRNELDGSIPNSFVKLTRLSELSLYNNLLEGPIPTFLAKMKSLQALDLSSNWFNDSIPQEFGALPSLKHLNLNANLLSGRIPPDLGNISSLVKLDLYNNRLSHYPPPELGKLRNLEYMDLSSNEFIGVLPPNFTELKSMTVFYVDGNNFIGTIPKFIASWTHLEELSLMGNNFEGSIPAEIFTLKNLTSLYAAELEGGEHFSLQKLNNSEVSSNLKYLVLRNVSLTGPIPEFIVQLPYLSYLDLSFNNLTGEIPTFVSQQRLEYIFLRKNRLNGPIPTWLTNLRDTNVDVSENYFINVTTPLGKISQNLNLFACCSNATNMNEWEENDYHCHNKTTLYNDLYINCGGESILIDGNTYEADLQPDGLSTFFLNKNKTWGYSSMGAYLYVQYPMFIRNQTCNISMVDAPLYQTARASPVSLKYFGFCLNNGNYKVKLHFAELALETTNDPSMRRKRVFDVEIQGKKLLSNFNIEEAARGVNKDITKVFNVTVNETRLEIHLYWAGKGSFGDNQQGPLISAISVSRVVKDRQRLSAIVIVGIVGSALIFSTLILLLFWKLGWFGGKGLHNEELKGIELIPGRFFNFRQIKAATLNFSTTNKLGEGGFGTVYKGVLPNGIEIAVKQLSAKSKQGIHEFANEIATISALQHPNLVRLMGCCAEDNQLLLVYEFMENNSLSHVLFGSEELRFRLNWPTRVNICLGIAKGLAFLHEESRLKIVHRDIKPTNILLDKNLNAKISDFGFAKLYEGENTHVITRIAGTTGYMAPEYAMRGHLTNKADVYSFGVVTLEIVSGQNSATYRPNDQSVYLLDLAYVLQEKGNLIELVDPTLGSDYSWKEAITILDLAMLCTNPSPTLRPTMSQVVKILEGKSKIDTTSISSPMDDFTMAKAIANLCQSTPSGSTSQERASDTTISHSISKEMKDSSTSADI